MQDIQELVPGMENSNLVLGNVATAGQPEERHLKKLAETGYKTVIDLRPPEEPRDFDEVATVLMAGMEYVNIPVTPETVGYEDFSRFRELLGDPARRPALVHCSTGGRVGGLMLAYLILDEGMAPEEAEETAAQVGLKNELLKQSALRYVSLMSDRQPANQKDEYMVPEIPARNEKDLHGLEYADSADLNIFFAGNQYPVVPELLEAFKERHPEARRVFYETLPPGLLAKQIRAGKARFRDGEINVRADVYLSTTKELTDELARDDLLEEAEPYVKNRLVLVVREGNPKNIRGLGDLEREDVRISMPNPETEGIAAYILDMYRDFGGEEFARAIMETKREAGTTLLTNVHHRETPDNLEQDKADVGPVWFTEYVEHETKGRGVEMVEVGEDYDQRAKITYYLAPLKEAPHPELARRFVDFVLSPEGQEIYARYGFVPAAADRANR